MGAHQIVQPEGWPPPKGYVNGIAATGTTLWVAGQIGRDATGYFASDLPGQIEQALRNVATVLATAGAAPEHVVRMTWYVTDIADYERQQRSIGEAYRRVMGRNFPAMTMVEVKRLVERAALVEIEATAVLP